MKERTLYKTQDTPEACYKLSSSACSTSCHYQNVHLDISCLSRREEEYNDNPCTLSCGVESACSQFFCDDYGNRHILFFCVLIQIAL